VDPGSAEYSGTWGVPDPPQDPDPPRKLVPVILG
jgi:hypothetical protein